MVRPNLVYNASTGSDTQASGAGPATAVFAANADGTIATTTITLNGTFDFTGAADDGGSDAAYCATAAGDRHMFSIASFTGGVGTCTAIETNETIDATFAAQNWAVGGKRQTFDGETTNRDWRDGESGWDFVFEAGTYQINETIEPAAGVGDDTDGPITFRSIDPLTVQPILDVNIGAAGFRQSVTSFMVIDGFRIERITSSSGGTRAFQSTNGGGRVEIRRCEIDAANMGNGIQIAKNGVIEDCTVFDASAGSSRFGIDIVGQRPNCVVRRCVCHGNLDAGIRVRGFSSFGSAVIDRCISYDNGGNGITIDGLSSNAVFVSVTNSVFDKNASSGMGLLDASPGISSTLHLLGNSYTNNALYGIDSTTQMVQHIIENGWSLFYLNTSGARNNVPASEGDITAQDPLYTNTGIGTEDYTPLTGSPLIDAGAPQRTG